MTITSLAGLVKLFEAIAALIAALVERAARTPTAARGPLLAEALDALERLEEASTMVPALIEDTAMEAAEGAARGPLGPLAGQALVAEVAPVGRGLENRLMEGAQNARDGSQRTIPIVAPDSVEQAQRDATTAHRDRLGRQTELGAYARTRTTHAERVARTAGQLAGLPSGARVKVKGRGGSCKVCAPLVGRTYAVSDAPRPPFHPSCDCRLVVVR